jgi:hypothetical protein
MQAAFPVLSSVALWLAIVPSLLAQSFPPGTSPASVAIGFGGAVAIAGDEILVGRPGLVLGFPMPPSQTGAVHVFRQGAGGSWREVGAVTAKGLAMQDGFGSAVAVDGKLLAVGAPGDPGRPGAVYVFERDGTGRWVERAKLTAASSTAGDRLGRAVALKDGVLLAGSPGFA